jgi:hypothetical protein
MKKEGSRLYEGQPRMKKQSKAGNEEMLRRIFGSLLRFEMALRQKYQFVSPET